MKAIQLTSMTGHTKSCVPCALAALLDKPYNQVNEWLKAHGHRKGNNRGTQTSSIKLIDFGMIPIIDWRTRSANITAGKKVTVTVETFVKQHPRGDYFILVSGHGLSLKDGVVYDTVRDSSRKRVEAAYLRENPLKFPSDFDKFEKDEVVVPTIKINIGNLNVSKKKVAKGEKTRIILAHFAIIGTGACTIKELMGISGASYIYCRYMLLERKRMFELNKQKEV